jgi:ATP-binding cassette subfamily B protein
MESLKLIKPYIIENRFGLIAGFVCLILVDILQLFLPRVIKWTIDDLTAFRIDLAGLSVYALYMVGIAAMIGILRYGWIYFINGMARRLDEGLRSRLFEHIQTLSASYFNKTKTGDLMAHATNDIQNIRMSVGIGVVTIIDTAFMGITAIIFMAYINVELTLAAVLPMPFIILISRIFSKKIHSIYGKVQETFSDMTEVVRERFAGIRIIKAYNREPESLEKLEDISGEYIQKNLKLARITGSFSPLVTFLSSLSTCIILYYGGRKTILSVITPGDFVAFTSYLGLLTWPMMATGIITNTIQRGKASLDRIYKILETRPEIHDMPDAKPVQDFRQEIVFEAVSFSYPDRAQEAGDKLQVAGDKSQGAGDKLQGAGDRAQVFCSAVLSEIDLKLKRGQTLGIIGPPGSGKTTLLNLLPRFFDVGGGKILADGTDIRELKLRDFRSLISFMPQEPFLFAGTIRENILFGNPDATKEELLQAVNAAALYDTIQSFPDGFETVVGEKGVILSGGQKQRIALARALIRKSPILILDDPISQVDTETASMILKTLRSLSRREYRTLIIVSHRISAVKFADRIITLKQGRITESGTHEQLIQDDTYYAKTFRLQQIEEELGL